LTLQSARIRNFKAIIDSQSVRFGALTAFVGNNGGGKSSLIEALRTWQDVVRDGLDAAMGQWLGIEHVRHKAKPTKTSRGRAQNPIVFEAALGPSPREVSRCELHIDNDPAFNRMAITDERVTFADKTFSARNPRGEGLTPGRSMFTVPLAHFEGEANAIAGWQFLVLQPELMGPPQSQQRTGGGVRLRRDGANIADLLHDIRRRDRAAFEGIVEAMRYVLPYARDLQPAVTSELERKAYLQMAEADFKVPGWMLSTGSLRMLALLSLLRHPEPPPLIVVEEIENGLDPRSIHLLVGEIRNAVLGGITQVVLTTHSPYLLDLLTLDQIVLVTRNEAGEPRFTRPADSESLQSWSAEFAPGRLYTMGKLHEAAGG
jgi:predicted ATPase